MEPKEITATLRVHDKRLSELEGDMRVREEQRKAVLAHVDAMAELLDLKLDGVNNGIESIKADAAEARKQHKWAFLIVAGIVITVVTRWALSGALSNGL